MCVFAFLKIELKHLNWGMENKMVVSIIDTKPRKVLLTVDEINTIIDCLGHQSHNLFTFLNCDEIIKKLNDSLQKK